MLGALPYPSFSRRWSRCVPREFHAFFARTGNSTQYFPGGACGAGHNRLWAILRLTCSPRFIRKGNASTTTETVDGITGGLGGGGIRSDLGQWKIDLVFLRALDRAMGRHGSDATYPSQGENLYECRAALST